MDVSQVTIKQEKVDNFTLATTEPNENYVAEAPILDLMEIKLEPIKLEPFSYDVPEPINLDQALKLSEKTETIKISNDEYKLDCSNSSQLVKEQQPKEDAGDSSKKNTNKDSYSCKKCRYKTPVKRLFLLHLKRHKKIGKTNTLKCEFCDFETVYGENLRRHIVKHKKSEAVMYKCDQCSYQSVDKQNLTHHYLSHKKSDEVVLYKCDQCDYNSVYKMSIQNHVLKHKNHSEKYKNKIKKFIMVDLCVSCSETCNNSVAINCVICGKWYHKKCISMTTEKFNYFDYQKRLPKGDRFKCSSCDKSEVNSLVNNGNNGPKRKKIEYDGEEYAVNDILRELKEMSN